MKKKKPSTISDSLIKEICTRLSNNDRVRRTLPEWGRVHIDRQLPFLCVYRLRSGDNNSISDGLITGEASYITATESRKQHKQISLLVKNIAKTLKNSFGSFLIVEVWVSAKEGEENEVPTYNSKFKIIRTKKSEILPTIETLERSLKEIKIRKKNAEVNIVSSSRISPPGIPQLISPTEAAQLGIHQLGIEVSPIYFDKGLDQVFPLIYQKLKKGFSRALNNSFFEFTRKNTPFRPPNFQSMGRRSMVKAVWDVDKQLAGISNSFDFLLQVTPINNKLAWSVFKRKHFSTIPHFIYRPLPIDPSIAKRELFKIPIERIEDPTLSQLFRERQLEIDRKFTMLIDRGTPRFLYGSLQLYGLVDDNLLKIAKKLLEQLPPRSRDESISNSIDSKTFAERAKLELDYFRETLPDLKTKILVREDISGLMVSKGNLLIGARSKIPAGRVEALIAHEVGTHVLTYLNGKTQPLQQLYIGLPGYDELQEGLAVLAEYLVGGLTSTRMRLLAARVVAAHSLIKGASFIEVFNDLNKVYGFERQMAFSICTRTFRGGGLTKDAVYLRGLVQLIEYLKKGGELEPLFIGKIASEHIPIIKELQWRKVLHPAPLLPRYFDDPKTKERLTDLKNGLSLINLIKK